MRAPASLRPEEGFTLPELMIAVAIVSILLTIALPRFADLIRRSKEGATKGNLGALRGALTIYYGDTEGWYPADDLSELAASEKYIDRIPVTKLVFHAETSSVSAGPDKSAATTDGGGWGYVSDPTDGEWGWVFVDCTHTDMKGEFWTGF